MDLKKVKRFFVHPTVAYPLSLFIGIYAGLLVEKRTETSHAMQASYTATQIRVTVEQTAKDIKEMKEQIAELERKLNE